MLLPRRAGADGVDNLLVAGRCASMTHDGHSAARVSGACFAMGQAAGTAAALALARGCRPHELPPEVLQRRLIEQRAFLGDDLPAARPELSGRASSDAARLTRR